MRNCKLQGTVTGASDFGWVFHQYKLELHRVRAYLLTAHRQQTAIPLLVNTTKRFLVCIAIPSTDITIYISNNRGFRTEPEHHFGIRAVAAPPFLLDRELSPNRCSQFNVVTGRCEMVRDIRDTCMDCSGERERLSGDMAGKSEGGGMEASMSAWIGCVLSSITAW